MIRAVSLFERGDRFFVKELVTQIHNFNIEDRTEWKHDQNVPLVCLEFKNYLTVRVHYASYFTKPLKIEPQRTIVDLTLQVPFIARVYHFLF